MRIADPAPGGIADRDFFTQAYHRGKATDVVAYLAAHAKEFGILKRLRKPPARKRR